MFKTIIKFTYEWKGKNTWEQTLTQKHLHKIYKIAKAK